MCWFMCKEPLKLKSNFVYLYVCHIVWFLRVRNNYNQKISSLPVMAQTHCSKQLEKLNNRKLVSRFWKTSKTESERELGEQTQGLTKPLNNEVKQSFP